MSYFTAVQDVAVVAKKKQKTNKSNTASYKYTNKYNFLGEWNLNKSYTYKYINGWRGLVVKIQDCGNFFKEFTEKKALQLSWEPGPIPGAGLCLFRSTNKIRGILWCSKIEDFARTRPLQGTRFQKGSKKTDIFQLNNGECLHPQY